MKVGEDHHGWQASPAPNFQNNAPTYGSNVRNDKDVVESATVAAVERTMKKYADNLLRVLEGMSGRLSQLESNNQRMENFVSGIKGEAANNHGSTDGKLRALENMIREVQRGVQVLRDKQEIAEAHSQLAKLQLSTKPEPPPPAKEIVQETVEPPPPRPPSAVNPSDELSAPSSPQVATPLPHHQPQQLQLQAHGHLLPPPPQLIPQPPQNISQPLQQQLALHMALQQPTHPQHQQLQVQEPPVSQISQPPQIISQPQHQQLAPHPQQLQTQGPSAPPQMPSQIPQQQVSYQSMQMHQPSQQQQQQLQVQAPPVSQPEPQYQPQQPPPIAQQSSPALPQQLHMQPYYSQQQQQAPPPPTPPSLPSPPQYGNFSQEVNNPYGPQSHALQPQGSYSQDLPPPYLPVGYGNQSMRPTSPPPQLAQMPLQHQLQQRPQQGPPNQQQPQQLGPSGGQMYEAPRTSGNQLPLPPPYQSQGQNAPQMYDQYPPSQYRMAQPVTPASTRSGYPQLPTAQPVQHAMPPAGGSNASSSSGAPVSANRVPIEEVIDKVAVMGFSKDQVRGVVRRLTENGQSVDLNIVLDKLMNGGGDVQQPPKGWFGR